MSQSRRQLKPLCFAIVAAAIASMAPLAWSQPELPDCPGTSYGDCANATTTIGECDNCCSSDWRNDLEDCDRADRAGASSSETFKCVNDAKTTKMCCNNHCDLTSYVRGMGGILTTRTTMGPMSASETVELSEPRTLYITIYNGNADMAGNPIGSDQVVVRVNGVVVIPTGTLTLATDEYHHPVPVVLPAGFHTVEIEANADRADGSLMAFWGLLSEADFS